MRYDIYKLTEGKEETIPLNKLKEVFDDHEISQLKGGEILTVDGSEYWLEEAMIYAKGCCI